MFFAPQKIIKDAAPGFIQAVLSQLCGLIIFLVLSVQLSKPDFGEINWTLAVLLSSFTILSFGADQLVVKKIAAGADASAVAGLFLLHTLLTGSLFYLLLLLGTFLFPAFFAAHHLLPWLALGKLAIYWASAFKQLANGREQYRLLALMMAVSNLLRAAALLALLLLNRLSVNMVIAVFIAGDAAELLVCRILAGRKAGFVLRIKGTAAAYKAMLKESLPQLGTTIVAAALARTDWILMGLMGMTVQLAHYSFAWKVYELATLPLLVTAPVLIPRFVHFFSARESFGGISSLLRIEMVVAAGTAMLLYLLWVPAADGITGGRYGAVNKHTILLLGMSIPLLYLSNLLWTILFTKHRLKQIFYCMLAGFVCNLAANLLLLPRYGGDGAAAAWLFSSLVQVLLLLYCVSSRTVARHACWLPACAACAFAAAAGAELLTKHIVALPAAALLLYLLLLAAAGALRHGDVKALRNAAGT